MYNFLYSYAPVYLMGCRNVKTIKGRKYLYFVSRQDGTIKAVYCGPAAKPDSEKKALKAELEHVRAQIDALQKNESEIRKKIRAIPARL